jgi:hypothetical protein
MIIIKLIDIQEWIRDINIVSCIPSAQVRTQRGTSPMHKPHALRNFKEERPNRTEESVLKRYNQSEGPEGPEGPEGGNKIY